MRCRYKHIAQLVLIFFLFPAAVQAACSADGYTVVFVNGIWNTEEKAEESKLELRDKLGVNFNNQQITYVTGYNHTHWQGGGDLIEAVLPQFDEYDLQTILTQMHDEVKTRKLLVVGHSQGSVYANKIYEYLVKHGEPQEAIGVYVVATPNSYVAGGGTYLNYEGDDTIYSPNLQVGAILPPPPNVMIKDWWNTSDTRGPMIGHGFIEQYMANFSGRIKSGIYNQLQKLQPVSASETGECFTAPEATFKYKAVGVALAVGEPVAVVVKTTGIVILNVGAVALKAYDFAYAAVGAIGNALSFDSDPATKSTTSGVGGLDKAGFALLKAIGGSSLNLNDLDELNGTSQGGAVALAVSKPPAPQQTDSGEVKGAETEKPQESLIPQPKGAALSSPGFGGGGGAQTTSAEISTETSTSTATSTTPESAASSTPEAVVPDGTPPSVATLTINGTELATTSPFATTPVATTTTTWSAVITFNEDISTAPTVKDGTASFDFTNGTDQTVNDCADANTKTFCFTYIPPPNIEAAVFWFFRVAGVQDSSGETLATTTYRFIVDTAGPILTLDASATNQILPTVTGTSSFGSATIVLLLNAIQYSGSAVNGAWSFAVQPGNELAEDTYPVIATSTDQYNNQVVHNWTLAVDLTEPILGITDGPAEGDSVASTSPVSFTFSATDATSLAYACALDGGSSSTCTSPYSFSPTPGARSFAVTATDAAGNATTTARSFVVLP